jgi:RNA polymerase sigma factor (sigma-70 family)
MQSPTEFVERYWRLALWRARRRSYQAGARGDPDEVLSDAVLGLWNAARTFDEVKNDAGDPIKWARRHIDNAITDGFRSRYGDSRYHGKADQVEVAWDVPEDALVEDAADVTVVNRVDVAKALALLDDRHRYVVHARFYEELTWRAIGEVLGVSEGRACQLGTEAHEKLRQALAT